MNLHDLFPLWTISKETTHFFALQIALDIHALISPRMILPIRSWSICASHVIILKLQTNDTQGAAPKGEEIANNQVQYTTCMDTLLLFLYFCKANVTLQVDLACQEIL